MCLWWGTWQVVEGRERRKQLLEGQHAVRKAHHARHATPMHHNVAPPSGHVAGRRVVQDRCVLGCESQPRCQITKTLSEVQACEPSSEGVSWNFIAKVSHGISLQK